MSGKNDRKKIDDSDAPDIDIDLGQDENTLPPHGSGPGGPPLRPTAPKRRPAPPPLTMESRPDPHPDPGPSSSSKQLQEKLEQARAGALNRSLKRPPSKTPAYLFFIGLLAGGLYLLGHWFYASFHEDFDPNRPLYGEVAASAPAAKTTAPAATTAPATATLEVDTDLVGWDILGNGQPLAVSDNKVSLSPGLWVILIRRAGYEDYTENVDVKAGETTVIHPVFTLREKRGFLTYDTAAEAKLTLYRDGQKYLVVNTPVRGLALPVGTYQAVLENSLMGYRSEDQIVVQEWKTTVLRKNLDAR